MIRIESVSFTNEFRAETTDWLLGNIGDKIVATIDFSVEWFVLGTIDIKIEYQPTGVRPVATNLIRIQNAGFAEFRIGDTIEISDPTIPANNGTYTIGEIIDDDTIALTIALPSAGTSPDGQITGVTPMKSHRLAFGLNENDEGVNLTDRATEIPQEYTNSNYSTAALAVVVPMVAQGSNEWKLGGATIERLQTGTAFGQQRFRIIHEFYITPFHIAGQYNDLIDRIAPSYFEDDNSLRYTFKIQASEDINDPNRFQEVTVDNVLGNVGWFDENFNYSNREQEYSIDSVTYTNVANGNVNSAIELTTDSQDVVITLKNTVNTPFFNNFTKFVLNASILPSNEDEYTDNGKNKTENLYFDRRLRTLDGIPAQGENFGTNQQFIETFKAEFVSTSEVTLTARFKMSQFMVDDLTARGEKRYQFFVSTQNHSLATEGADKVSLLVDVNDFFEDFSDDSLVVTTNKFLEHYESDTELDGSSVICGRKRDDILAYSRFYINRLGRETDTIVINSIDLSLVAKHTDGRVFSLESYSQSFAGTNFVDDSQYINISNQRSFQMPLGDQRKTINVSRREDLDTVDFRYYDVSYPFLIRWEDWEVLANVDNQFHDVNENNNGNNHDWHRYDLTTDWDIYYRVSINIIKNGAVLNPFVTDTRIETFDNLEDADWINEITRSFDESNNELLNGGKKFFRGGLTKIQADKDYVGGGGIGLSDVAAVMKIEIENIGGSNDTRWFSSVYDWTENSWFKSIDTSNKIVLTQPVAGTFRAEAFVDLNLLPDNKCYTITTRFYDKSVVAIETFCILQENGDKILKEDLSGCIEVEH